MVPTIDEEEPEQQERDKQQQQQQQRQQQLEENQKINEKLIQKKEKDKLIEQTNKFVRVAAVEPACGGGAGGGLAAAATAGPQFEAAPLAEAEAAGASSSLGTPTSGSFRSAQSNPRRETTYIRSDEGGSIEGKNQLDYIWPTSERRKQEDKSLFPPATNVTTRQQQQQEQQQSLTKQNNNNINSTTSPNHIISSIVNKSSSLLNNLKQQYLTTYMNSTNSSTAALNNMTENNYNNNNNKQEEQQKRETLKMRNKRDISERQLSDSSFFYSTLATPSSPSPPSPSSSSSNQNNKLNNNNNNKIIMTNKTTTTSGNYFEARPPLPPPPPKEVLANVVNNQRNSQLLFSTNSSSTSTSASLGSSSNVAPGSGGPTCLNPLTMTQSLDVTARQAATSSKLKGIGGPLANSNNNFTFSQIENNNNNNNNNKSSSSGVVVVGGSIATRRHAIQEQSLERDAALSLKLQQQKEHKHKRTASIKSALRHAHIGPLGRHSTSDKHHSHFHGFSLSNNNNNKDKSSSSSADHHHHNQKDSSNDSSNNNNNSGDSFAKSMPYELFEPPITQRTFQRSKRRDAMLSDPKRQLSADTIGLRQLTDEYLHNAGVKPISSSGQCSLVALTLPHQLAKSSSTINPSSTSAFANAAACIELTGGNSVIPALAAGQQPATLIENKLYQFSKHNNAACSNCLNAGNNNNSNNNNNNINNNNNNNNLDGCPCTGGSNSCSSGKNKKQKQSLCNYNKNNLSSNNGSEDSLSFVAILPGALPWQSDVSIQCELLQGPPVNDFEQPYETTGDILNTIALPFRGSTMQLADLSSGSLDNNNSSNQFSATLKRGLSAVISNTHSHLSPAAAAAAAVAATSGPVAGALQVVGGNLKKSLSNTLDISLTSCVSAGNGNHQSFHLQSQDSLPAYTSFHNEPEADQLSMGGGAGAGQQQQINGDHLQTTTNLDCAPNNSLIGQLASKLGRQSSKKFTASKKGLHRALSFDCRGYKRLEGTAAAAAAAVAASQQNNNNNNNQTNSKGSNLLMATKTKSHNKSTLGLNSDQSPRPYLPQSASQVDFQLPLLPYHKMQEAIVGQRLLEPPKQQQQQQQSAISNNNNNNTEQHVVVSGNQSEQNKLDADQLLCAQPSSDFTPPVEPERNSFLNTSKIENNKSECNNTIDKSKDNWKNVHSSSNNDIRSSSPSSEARRSTAPRLVLDIPTITMPSQQRQQQQQQQEEAATLSQNNHSNVMVKRCKIRSTTTRALQKKTSEQALYNEENDFVVVIDDDDEDNGGGNDDDDDNNKDYNENGICCDNNNNKNSVIVCLPSPNVAIDSPFNALSSSPSFCIETSSSSNKSNQLKVGLSNNTGGLTSNGSSHMLGPNQLSANDVFTQNLIKRPSTMLPSDAMSQVALALNNSSSQRNNNNNQQQQQQQNVVLRNRRQAIVPPKLTTDASNSDTETTQVGQLVDVDDQEQDQEQERDHEQGQGQENNKDMSRQMVAISSDVDETMRAHRRKRSGGVENNNTNRASTTREQNQNSRFNSTRHLSESQSALPTFNIEQDASCCVANETQIIVTNTGSSGGGGGPAYDSRRPDSQTTNIDSIVSSGSSTNLSLSGKRGEFTVTSPGGLTVSFGSSRGRRRSSIAVIPQMQICPGDLLVYSKQLIDRMNQTDNDSENAPPQFLTIDDKKGKNIWSSLKLCAQFDNRTMKARNELLCSLEDVLASLQPSTFVDEQLSHYKGMVWSEFLYETESRRSASSEILSVNNEQEQFENNDNDNDNDNQTNEHKETYRADILALASNEQNQSATNGPHEQQHNSLSQESAPVGLLNERQHSQQTISATGTPVSIGRANLNKERLKLSISGGLTGSAKQPAGQQPMGHHKPRDTVRTTVSSRFREKPKLKRGQTVDSVFRIPLIPSSPLKHAQQHQQTPTAHLEDHNNILLTIEDDERSSINSRDSVANITSSARHSRSSSTRSRSGSNRHNNNNNNNNSYLDKKSNSNNNNTNHNNSSTNLNLNSNNDNNDSSFETDDSMELAITGMNKKDKNSHQIVRQSSLSTLSSTITRTEQKRQRALWDLFQSECTFFFDHLLTLKNVYMEPLKKIQVEGFAMFADPDVLFGNLDELCCGVYDFCKEFLYIIMRTLKTRPEELNATDVLIKLYKKNPKIDHLRGVYHRYTLNYINALTYLESLRKQVEFVEFEKWSSRDVRCKKLQLTDLLVAPVQHIMRVPIILKDIESHTEHVRDRDEIRAILAVEEASLRELDDKMRWLKNFERLLEIQKNISWPSVLELDPKLFIPDFLKEVLSKQPCERLIVSPRRQIVHEGTLSNLDLGKASDMHVILFDDMLLLTRRKKGLTKKASTVCKSNSGSSSHTKDDGSFKYIVYKQPLSLDRFYVHDVQQVDAQAIGMKHLFLLIVMNRFQQISNVHSFLAPNDDVKQTWLFKIKKTAERWKKNFSGSSNEQQQQQQQQQQQRAQYNDQGQQQQNYSHQSGHNQSQQAPTLTRVINRNEEMINRQAAGVGGVNNGNNNNANVASTFCHASERVESQSQSMANNDT